MDEITKMTNTTTTVTVPDIVCGGCAGSIKGVFGNLPGISAVEVDVASKRVTIEHDESILAEKIVAVLEQTGFPVE